MDYTQPLINQPFNPSGILYIPYQTPGHISNVGAHISNSAIPMGPMTAYSPNTIPLVGQGPPPRSLLERMNIPPVSPSQVTNTGRPPIGVHQTVPAPNPPESCHHCRTMLYYDRSRKAPLLPQILDRVTKRDWIDDLEELDFEVPAPLILDPQSFFRNIDDFFTITREELNRLSREDVIRFERASRNTDPQLRTHFMRQYADAYIRRLSRGGYPEFLIPYSIPERYWVTIEDWMRSPENIPGTVGRSVDPEDKDDYMLGWWSVTTHLWVSDVTWSRDYHLINLLLVLFSFRGRVIIQLWDLIPHDYQAQICRSHPLPWQFRVPNNVAFRCKYDHLRIEDLTAFLIWLVEIAKFPFTPDAVDHVCDWADRLLRGEHRNPFSTSDQNRGARGTVVREAHKGKPWEYELKRGEWD